MITVSILYPAKPGNRFDADYYLKTHMPRSLELLGDAIKECRVERGVQGMMPGSPPNFVALCHFVCESIEAFATAFLPNAPALQADMANYTDIEPIIQFSNIELVR